MSGIFGSSNRDRSGGAPGRFHIGGANVACSHCGGHDFEERSALLNTAGMSLINLDWAEKEANLLVCSNCSHVEWFVAAPTRVGPVA